MKCANRKQEIKRRLFFKILSHTHLYIYLLFVFVPYDTLIFAKFDLNVLNWRKFVCKYSLRNGKKDVKFCVIDR